MGHPVVTACPFHGSACKEYAVAPLGTMYLWPPEMMVPDGWMRIQRQPVAEYPAIEPVIERSPPGLLLGLGFLRTPSGWLLPDLPQFIMRVRR